MERIPDVAARRAVRSEGVKWSDAAGRVSLRRPKFGPFGTRVLRVLRIPPDLTVHLDALGSAAWLAMDGRTVKEVLAHLQATFPGESDLGPRLGKFVGAMVSRGLVRLE